MSGWGGGGGGGVGDEHVGGVGAEGDAFFFEGEDDAAAQFPQDDVALVGVDADLDGIGDGAAFDLVDAEDDGVGDGDGFEAGVVADLFGYVGEQGGDFGAVSAGVGRDGEGSDQL